jgi:hypothetical protein
MDAYTTSEDWGWFIDIDVSSPCSSYPPYVYKTQRKKRVPIIHTLETISECPTEVHEELNKNTIKCSVTKNVCFYGEPRVLCFISILLVLSIVEIFLV